MMEQRVSLTAHNRFSPPGPDGECPRGGAA